MNGRATSIDPIDDEPDYKSYRVLAALNTNPDLRSYPFDRHTLTIEFEDKNQSIGELVYHATILPALVIVASGFLSLMLGPDKALQRLGINTSALIGAIMFHVNLTSQLPPVGYLTLADKYMIVNYVGLVAALAATVALLAMGTGATAPIASRVHRQSSRWIPVLWAVGQVAVFTVR